MVSFLRALPQASLSECRMAQSNLKLQFSGVTLVMLGKDTSLSTVSSQGHSARSGASIEIGMIEWCILKGLFSPETLISAFREVMTKVRIGIVGFGAVGRATASIISQHKKLIERRSGVTLELNVICRRSGVKPPDIPAGARVVSSWKDLVCAPDVDIVVEVMGGTEQSLELVRAALEAGKPVVTANKNLLAEHGDQLFALAASRNLPIGFEASVASSIPIVRVIHESSAGDQLRAVHGIMNGTANYILTEMESRGIEFDNALHEAQKAGYAESDPSLDIDGIDSRDKLCILARMAFGGRLNISRIPTCGIRQIRSINVRFANRHESTIRLIGSAENTEAGLEVSVRPWMLSRHSLLARVQGVNNAIFITGNKIGTQMFYGRGAGGDATGAVVVSDLIEIACEFAEGRLRAKNVSGFINSPELEIRQTPRPVRWCLHLTAKDQRGTVARLAELMAAFDIHIASLEQESRKEDSQSSFVITVEPVSEPMIGQVVKAINALDFLIEPALLLRME
jgi:homoserine dehydrogenase